MNAEMLVSTSRTARCANPEAHNEETALLVTAYKNSLKLEFNCKSIQILVSEKTRREVTSQKGQNGVKMQFGMTAVVNYFLSQNLVEVQQHTQIFLQMPTFYAVKLYSVSRCNEKPAAKLVRKYQDYVNDIELSSICL
jgi:hypothetical protein